MMYEVYDYIRVVKMGKDEGYMGSFESLEDVGQYLVDYGILFESYPIIEVRYEDKVK